MPRPHLTLGKDPIPIVKEAGWASGPVWTGAENLAPTGIRSPERPARRQSLYRLRYPDHYENVCMNLQGGSNMTGTDLYVNKPHCAAAVRP